MRGIGSVVPLDLEFLATLLRRPGVIGNDRDAAQRIEAGWHRRCRQLHDSFDACYFQRLGGVERSDGAAIDRAALDRRIFHPRHDDVDAVGCSALHDVAKVDDRNWMSHIAPGARWFEAKRAP